MRKAAAVPVLLTVVVLLWPPAPFPGPLPDGVPTRETWEKVSGEAVGGEPRLRVQYELYVNPARPALYELIRYRVSRADGSKTDEHPGLEKVQWHVGANDFRRYPCGPAPDGAGACAWRRMAQDSDEFVREVPVILWIYGAHRQQLVDSRSD